MKPDACPPSFPFLVVFAANLRRLPLADQADILQRSLAE
jgi:hypothetical protein